MKFRVYNVVIGAILVGACGWLPAQVPVPPTVPNPAVTAPGTNAGSPMIVFDNNQYDFGKAAAGEQVKHTYLVTNTGTATLDITDVHPSCGCTTAGGWTHQIAPGQSGTIPIQFNSSRYSGAVTKTITVTSNAKNEPRATLILHGTIWKPIDITPQTAVINVQADSTNTASTSVRIITQTDSPVTISEPASSSKSFGVELKTVIPGKEYQLIITVEPPFDSRNMTASISMKTSLPNTPVLSVTAIASVQQAIQLSPTQITLNPAADRWTTNRVFIRGNGNTPLVLEEPQSSDSRLKLEIVPLGMRGMFNLVVAIPPDFEIPLGQRVQLSVKSNQPRHPLITIPVAQLPRPRSLAGQSPMPMPVFSRQMSTNGATLPPTPHP